MKTSRRKSPIKVESVEVHMCSVDLRLEILSKVPFFAGLSRQDISSINRLFREHGCAPGETIYSASDPAERLFVLASGRVKLVQHTLGGKDVLLDILTPGEFFGSLSALGDQEYPDTAQALTESCILRISADDFRAVLDAYPSVALRVLDVLAGRLKAAQEMVRQLSAHSAEKRIAFTLLKLGEKLGVHQEVGWLIQVPLSREDLAQLTGTTTETASRVISQFQKDGLIASGRQWVAITDLPGLQTLARQEYDQA
ncbi:MAG TPA: Crp/Fnr family transcriptional regulator [Anaerolineales bacterium]|nr:Crp/Fnr family transcriptional regulator [Anaerolineales bacterium]